MDNRISKKNVIPKDFFTLADFQAEVENDMLEKDNVVGISLGEKIRNGKSTGDHCLSILVNHKMPRDLLNKQDLIDTSKKIEGQTVDIVEVGDIMCGEGGSPYKELDFNLEELPQEHTPTATRDDQTLSHGHTQDYMPQAVNNALTRRVRPVEGGYSVGHYRVTAGTMASACYDSTRFGSMPNKFYMLSNNHVLANSNIARAGDPILQPGRVDGGSYPRDVVARLSRWVPIKFHTSTSRPLNYVDAAIAEGDFQDLDREIFWAGYVRDRYSPPTVGERVKKTGRTTAFTMGKITNINATVDVNYGAQGLARFTRQILTTNMSAGGDSGSLVLDNECGAVGLLFAGSPYVTLLNNIAYVQALLRIRLTEND